MSIPSNSVRAVDYFQAAFGGFAPQDDEDAAIKFILNCILVTERFDILPSLIQEDHPIGRLEGDPEWTLQRRDVSKEAFPAFGDWPAGSRFCAYVDPSSYELAHPKFFMDRSTFMGYLRAALKAYAEANPQAADSQLISSLSLAT
jgi:hypothetical protein